MNLPLQLDRENKTPLQDQLFGQLRQLIVDGRLKPNTRVIATRFLAEQVGVSRTTVLLAYERLISEGYLETRPAIGTFVSASLPDDMLPDLAPVPVLEVPRQAALRPALLGGGGNGHADAALPKARLDLSPSGYDASNMLAPKVWVKCVRDVFDRYPTGMAAPLPTAGVASLRRAIADHLTTSRGLMTTPDQVFIVAGRRQACGLVAHLFQRTGDTIVLESPGGADAAMLFKLRRAEILHVPVDDHGLCTDQLPERNVALAYVTPARHNPLGGIMPQARRDALIAWARRAGAYIIEDDSDSEFRYHGTTPQPLAATDPYGLVFHTGSFAKTLGAGLGLGYLVVPPEFVDAVADIKSLTEADRPWLEQMVVADLLASGTYDHHLRRVRKIYMERRDCLIGALFKHFGDVALIGADAGTQLTWLLPDHFPAAETVRERASIRGVTLGTVSAQGSVSALVRRYCDRALILGFGAVTRDALDDAVACVADAVGA